LAGDVDQLREPLLMVSALRRRQRLSLRQSGSAGPRRGECCSMR
jgi:hypothetical protein